MGPIGSGKSTLARVLAGHPEYKVSEAADRNAGMVLKINKEQLKGLAPVIAK